MDAQFWIYIIIGVIFFLSKLLKKPEPSTEEGAGRPSERGPASQTTSEKPRQLTFEELLREITEGKQPPKPETQPVPRRRYERFDDDLRDEARSLEEVPGRKDDAEVFKVYEQAQTQVFQRSSLEETLQLKDTVMDFGKFKIFEEKKRKTISDDYMKFFRNPENLKQAIVMSEILKRKF